VRARTVTLALAVVIVSALTHAGRSHIGQAQTDQATLRVVAPSESVSSSTKQVDVSIDVENASNLGGFQFVLAYDPAVLEAITATKTQFLAQTGREIVCRPPTIDQGGILLACATLREQPAGVDGAGTIATVSFKPIRAGSSDLILKNVKLVHPDSSEEASAVEGSRITVSGDSWWTPLHLGLIAIVAVVAVGMLAALVAFWRARSRRTRPSEVPADNPTPVGRPPEEPQG
jgi:Cohesin domain